MRLILAFIVLLLFFSCQETEKNSIKPTDNQIISKKTDSDSQSYEIASNKNTEINENKTTLDLLSELPQSKRSELINSYFEGNKECLTVKRDNYLVFRDDSLLKTELVQKIDKNVLLFSTYQNFNGKFVSTFFIFQNYQNSFISATKLFIADNIITSIKQKMNVDFFYEPYENTFRYVSDSSEYPILLDFRDSPEIKIFKDGQWMTLEKIEFSEDKINLKDISDSKAVSYQKIDTVSTYYDINKALEHPENVKALDLSSSYLSYLSPEIKLLKNLKILILNDNDIANLPDEICELKNLDILQADDNSIKELPADFGNLANLEELSLSNNHLQTLPPSFEKLNNLKYLHLNNNNLTEFNSCKGLKQLVMIDLSDNKIEYLPEDIDSLKNLVSLNLQNNPIEHLPNQIMNLKNLTYINIIGTKIPDDEAVKLFEINPDINVEMN